MKRYKAYDPPEYWKWVRDEGAVEQFKGRLASSEALSSGVRGLSTGELLGLYRSLLRARLHDVYLKRWVKNGVITKAWLATGEEAVTVGSVRALRRQGREGDVVGPMIRNAAACIEMGLPLVEMFGSYLALNETVCRGRDLHIGDLRHGVVAPISHVGSLMPVMVGCALAFKMRREDRVAMTWVGDGSSKTGEFHEGANFAAANKLPIVIFIQNNQVALGTRTDLHNVGDFSVWADAYGMHGEVVDGNNVLDVFLTSQRAVERARAGQGPTLIVAETFRMGGHATHDEREARDLFAPEVFEAWGKRDPIGVFEEYLLDLGVDLAGGFELGGDLEAHNRAALEAIDAEVTEEMERAGEAALALRAAGGPDPADLLDGVYA